MKTSAVSHAVASVTKGSKTTSFTYDTDGNLTTETGATTLTWTPFNLPSAITYNNKAGSFTYDADHNRVMQTEGTSITNYLPDGEQTPGGVWHTYFEVDGERVVEDWGPTGGLSHRYFHNDNQNTMGYITDDTLNPNTPNPVENELSDVFGQPRLASGAIDPNWGTTDVSKRRYINQEDLTDAQLIDLNARVYDPLLAKFMSPDPVIADMDDSQSWNAYAYSHNNPMSKEDPTGLWYVEGRLPSSSAAGFGGGQDITDFALATAAADHAAEWAPIVEQLQKTIAPLTYTPGGGSGQANAVVAGSTHDVRNNQAQQAPQSDGAGSRPDLEKVADSPAVAAADKKAWNASNPGMPPEKRQEHGFWINKTKDGGYVPGDIIAGDSNHSIAGNSIPPPTPNSVIWYHTHPNPRYESDPATHEPHGWFTGPSPQDKVFSRTYNVALIIHATDGFHYYGPQLGSPLAGTQGQ